MDWGQKLKGSPAGGQQSLFLVVRIYFPGNTGKEKFPGQPLRVKLLRLAGEKLLVKRDFHFCLLLLKFRCLVVLFVCGLLLLF